MSDANEAPNRRRLRFSLRTLLLVVAALSIWLGWNVYQVKQRQRMEQYVSSLPSIRGNNNPIIIYGSPKPWKSLPIMWRILGVKPVRVVDLRDAKADGEDLKQIRKWFPEADVY